MSKKHIWDDENRVKKFFEDFLYIMHCFVPY